MQAHDPTDLYKVLQVDPGAHAEVIRAAYHALARLYHPDQMGSAAGAQVMSHINRAYAVLRDAGQREAYDRARHAATAAPQPGPAQGTAPAAPDAARPERPQPTQRSAGQTDAAVLQFGRYRGWTLSQLVRHDPDYLRWLRRHSSGIRYRREIDALFTKEAAGPESRSPKADGRARSRSFWRS